MLGSLPAGWRRVRLEEVCEHVTVGHVGSMANEYVEDGIPFLRSQNILPFQLDLSNTKFITPAFHRKLKKSALRPGDVCIVRTGYPGTACVVPKSLPVANCADLVVIRPSNQIDPWYIASIFNSVWGQGTVSGNLVGVAQQHFNVGAAKAMQIPLPPLPTQRRIASVLSAYDDLIENNTRRIAILEEMARRLYEEWFVQFRFPGHEEAEFEGELPEGWKHASLADLTCYINRGIPPKYDENAEGLVINQKCVRDQRLNLEPARRQCKPVPAEKLLRFGDILINSTGVGTLGRVAQVLEPLESCTTDSHVTIVRANPQTDTDFLGLTLFRLQSHFEDQGVGSTGQTELSRGRIAETECVIPPQPLQRFFGETVRPLRVLCVKLLAKNANLRAQRDLLLPKLISGEIDVSNLPLPGAEDQAA